MKSISSLTICLMAIAAVALAPAPASAAASGSTTTCYNCDHFSGHWDCKSGSLWGGTSCTVSQDSCTVSGDCSSSSGTTGVSMSFDASVIMSIAMSHPRAAATLYTMASNGKVADLTVVSWYNDELTIDDVDTLLREGEIGLEAVTPGVVFESTITPFGSEGDLLLRMVPVEPSDLDPALVELLVYLTPSGSEGAYVASGWDIIQ